MGGNVLTSQRIVDVVLKAFDAAADSQGCMNNITFGQSDWGYYETVAGGAGAVSLDNNGFYSQCCIILLYKIYYLLGSNMDWS